LNPTDDAPVGDSPALKQYPNPDSDESGMELWDLLSDRDFRRRPERTQSGLQNSGDAFVRLAGVLFWDAKTVLQELVKVAVEFCGADASGISMEECVDGQLRFRWVAIAGTFSE
jgi:hypothetical protein